MFKEFLVIMFSLLDKGVRIEYGDIGVAILAFCLVVALYCLAQMAIAVYDFLFG